ncbi:hypothetical protein DFH08DRAFT_881155 [Mycena albidolilacea]|uniref:Uncharacterized protein n=1 Tax=Mycena albidolilacea TaxID=1033008 RepID=A0AAD7EJY1_9AGAR|nr:hypothetical protein DFH08DRAFT_881155 [Mycena albidolilacea]
MTAFFNGPEPLSQARRDQAVSDSPSLPVWIMVFDILSALGFISVALVFLTVLLSPNVKRISTWYLYMLAWWSFTLSPFLVIGHQTHFDPPPSFALCLVDSALIYASCPFAAFATLSLTLQLYLNITTRMKGGNIRPVSGFVLLAIPLILYLFMFLWTLILGILNPDRVKLEPGGLYCHLDHSPQSIVGAGLVLLATFTALVIEVMIVILLARHWRAFRALQRPREHTVSLSIIIRVLVFAIFPVIGLGLGFTASVPGFTDRIFPAYNLFLASLPTAAALIFGSQSDILHVWMFWRVERKTTTQLSLTTVGSDNSSVKSV